MDYRNFIAVNFAYGTGPYLRTTELAIAVNDCLEKQGHKRLGIIVPLVYGAKQKRIMREEFGDFYKSHPGEILFDGKLGIFLKSIFYGSESYNDYLKRWVLNVDKAGESIHRYLLKKYGSSIAMELHRSPRVSYNIAPSYFVSFSYVWKIYERLNLSDKAARKIKAIEESHRMHFITEPGTFSYEESGNIPLTINLPRDGENKNRAKGIFVTVTGIPGLERLYAEGRKLGIKVFSNDVKSVPLAEHASPHIIGSKKILFQFARSGWSSVWTSQLSGTPLIVPEWDKNDDPEIYFNNICIEKLGLGIVYRGESFKEILKKADELRPGIERYNKNLRVKFGTLDGTRYAAERIALDCKGFLA